MITACQIEGIFPLMKMTMSSRVTYCNKWTFTIFDWSDLLEGNPLTSTKIKCIFIIHACCGWFLFVKMIVWKTFCLVLVYIFISSLQKSVPTKESILIIQKKNSDIWNEEKKVTKSLMNCIKYLAKIVLQHLMCIINTSATRRCPFGWESVCLMPQNWPTLQPR